MATPNNAPDIKVGHKTADEIKKGLEHCINGTSCRGCPYCEECAIASDCNPMQKDLREYIQQLQAENKQCHQENTEMYAEMCMLMEKVHRLEAELDAALEDKRGECKYCAYLPGETIPQTCFDCANKGFYRWEWRGVQKEENNNGKE